CELLLLTLFIVITSPIGLSSCRQWCEHTVEDRVKHVLSPRLQLEVSCSAVYQYNMDGWRLDVDRMRNKHGGDDGIALYYRQSGQNASCFLFKPPEMESHVVNRTVTGCCEGWAGPHCTQGVSLYGRCFSTWNCEEFPGLHNSSLMPIEKCCSTLWGLSWKNASDQTCLSCTYNLLTDVRTFHVVRSGLLGTSRAPRASGTCMTWGGAHYRTFDGKHFHFQGSCTYLLASSTDGTWAVYISTVCDRTGECSKVLKMMLGLDLISIQQRNLTLNNIPVPHGKPLFQNGISVHWLGDFIFLESGLGVRLKFDLINTVYLTVTAEHLAATRGLCGVYNNNPEDDFRKVDGTVSPYAASFGNSWRVADHTNEDCSDAAELGHSCDVVEDVTLRRQAESVCHQLLENPFTHCHFRVDPAAYIDTCLYLYCSLPTRERDGGVCDTLATYARECAQQHIIIMWRTPSLCGRVCPRGQVFSDCVSSCPPSCASPHPPGPAATMAQCREECVGGCECPPGLFLHQGTCLKAEDCPCFHRRLTYQPGDSIQQRCNTCVCRSGQWQCTGERCAGQCTLVGALQVTTFDKKRYSLQGGDCAFIAVKDFVDRKLMVTVRCGECSTGGPQQGCLKEVSITALSTTVTITDTGTVTVNGVRQTLPVVSSDLAVHRASSSFILVQTFGALLLWHLDGPFALIHLQPGFAHKVHGLCGTLTWSQHDDFTTPEGDVEMSVSAFAEKSISQPCTLPKAAPSDPCSTYTQRISYAERVCSVIHNPVFQKCHDVVEKEPYFRLCLSEVCACALQRSCHCTVLTAYAQHCAQEGVLVHWRNQTFCHKCLDFFQCMNFTKLLLIFLHSSVCKHGAFNCTQKHCKSVQQCPGSLVYSPRSCMLTCSSLDHQGQQQSSSVTKPSCIEPLSGCVCPQGTFFHGDRCVLPDECPCHHNGQVYYTNETITKDCNTCVCQKRRWHCTRLVCDGVCVATGDPHYVTFDGRRYSFLGDCQYVLATETSGLFSITAENVPCGSTGVTCTKSVTFSLGSTIIHLLRGKAVTVNGMPVTLPKSYSGSGLTLEKVGLFVSLSSRLGVTLMWDGGMRVYVHLAAHLRGRVGGLCGNFDEDTENDFTTHQGSVESTAEVFGNSWKVSPSCPDVENQDLRDPCALNPHRVTWAKKRCAVLTQDLFSVCHTEVPFQHYYDWCVFDACGCDSGGDCECLCTAIASYAEECNRRGVYVRWRSQELCPLQCEKGMIYEPCGPACSQSCPSVQQRSYSRCEVLSCVEGCFCPAGTIRHGDGCILPLDCPCEWEGSMFPPGTSITQRCQNCSCVEGLWQCEGVACPASSPPCLEAEFACATGRCIPSQWLCDNEDDCGDGSDEICPLPMPLCPAGEFQCANGKCLASSHVCDGRPDCGFADGSDEQGVCVKTQCMCAPGEFQCPVGNCVPAHRVCDGHRDCPAGTDEAVCPRKALQDSHFISTICNAFISVFDCLACRFNEFSCASGGQCVPLAWRCDGESDCMDGSDEQDCGGLCGFGHVPCLSQDQCVHYLQLFLPAPPERTNTSISCPEYTCMDGTCVCNSVEDCPDASLTALAGSTDEQSCRAWSSWGPWGPCSTSCGTGSMSRERSCPHGDPLRHCRGQKIQHQPCFRTTCPVDGQWLSWVSWSNCSTPCGGVQVRQRSCTPPRYGGQDCSQLPGPSNLSVQIKPCPADGCVEARCPPNLVRHSCGPCPMSCAHISSGTSCDSPCFSGCWCPVGQVMNHMQQCVSPDECMCEVAGVYYWPGQQIKTDCKLCVCERGKPQKCQPIPDCTVHCGWSSWSEWGDCLGPCGVQSVQWSFRSPNNPSKHGNGRACRGIHRKARRCQTAPCKECKYQGQTHTVGDRWRSQPCQLCRCLSNLMVECTLYCQYDAIGCPPGLSLVHEEESRCCYCQGDNGTAVTVSPGTVTSKPVEGTPPLIPTYPLPSGEKCWVPLGVQILPNSSFTASSHQAGHPPEAARLHSPEPEEYKELPEQGPDGSTNSLYLQIDLLKPYNITGVLTQGGGAFGTYVSGFYLQFSQDGGRWYTYRDIVSDAKSRAKVFRGNRDDQGVAENRLDRMVLAQFVRLLPHDFQHGIFLRLEIMGCGDGRFSLCRRMEFQCGNGRCVQAGPMGVICNGVDDCGDGSDEMFCDVTPSEGFPGLHNQTVYTGRPGYHGDTTTGFPGLATTSYHSGFPGVATDGVTGPTALENITITGSITTLAPSQVPHDGGLPRVLCMEGWFGCGSFECVDSSHVCGGRKDCLDGSDEEQCTTARPAVTSQHPLAPSRCSPKQFSCTSGECIRLDRRCNLLRDCADGSDEGDCVDCIMSPWTAWSSCSVTCGLGSLFRQREILRDALPRGSCGGAQFDSRACFPQACPVHGHWSEWSEWSVCDALCGGGIRTRNRNCSSPPPKNGGQDCSGMTLQSQSCNHHPCTNYTDIHRGCVGGMVLVTQEDCQTGRVGPCPSICSDLSMTSTCTASCIEAFICLPSCWTGQVKKKNGSCQHHPLWLLISSAFLYVLSSLSSCEAGFMHCQSFPGCHVDGGWGQWAAWTQCSLSCGTGLQSRRRSCDNPAAQGSGRGCMGAAEQTKDCNTQTCKGTHQISNTEPHIPPGGCRLTRVFGSGAAISVCVDEWDCICKALWIFKQVCKALYRYSVEPWLAWSQWSQCSVSCGGGQQSRFRLCSSPPCHGLSHQSKTCNIQVCLDVGCPPGRLYRECERGEGCPFSCAQVSGREGCYSDGCEEGCHCPLDTYQHRGLCLSECPCLVDKKFLSALQRFSATTPSPLLFYNISEGMEVQPGNTVMHECSFCGCEHGRWNCSLEYCPIDGGLSPWGPWSSCSLSCGGVGVTTRSRGCTQPSPAHGGRDCQGPLQETTYCQAPDCPEDSGFSPWSTWSPCTKTCTDVQSPAVKSRHRSCVRPPCSGNSHQDKPCNLPQCPGEICLGAECAGRNCTWTEWGEWSLCSRSCGVGQQQRIRTYFHPGTNGSWCEDIIGGNLENRFCNIRPCRVNGGWSRWSPWSRCDKLCGGGRSIRTRSCSSPPPKNGGQKCEGEKNQIKPCNTKPCEGKRCPASQEFDPCASQCPQRCSDLQQGLQCQGDAECQPGCRCPKGQLQQDGLCVEVWQCDCVDSAGQIWAAGSWHQVDCNNCSCSDGKLLCSNHSCQLACVWSSWSSWAQCSVSCGQGQRTRYRSLVPETEGADCNFEEVQHKLCNQGHCPSLCLLNEQELDLGDTWLQGECEQCICTPEGVYCQDIDCRVDGRWTPWSVWADCSVTCGGGTHVRTRACINPPPRNNGSDCSGPDRETRDCQTPPCLDNLCRWSPWSPCSQSCGAGSASRRRLCLCDDDDDGDEGDSCPPEIEAEKNREETQLCYKQPCPGCPMSAWSVWSQCSCVSQRQQRYRVALTSATRGQQCNPVETQSRKCSLSQSCEAPFVYSACGAPCEKQCSLLGQHFFSYSYLQGLLQLNGSCVSPENCGCVYLQHQAAEKPPSTITVPQGGTITIDCSTCLCHEGVLHCDTRECDVILSEWSEWTRCSPCILSSSDQLSALVGGVVGGATMVSIQKRFRACLDLDSGFPVPKEEESQCSGLLVDERLCPDQNICRDLCLWSVWSAWTACAEPCSGGVRHRFRWPLKIPPGPRCQGRQTQSQSCNTGLCPGERCEDRERIYQQSCANQCPRSCTDLWEHVQCLQGGCHSGCRCPEGQLLQDGHCVPVAECRCGIPSGNGTLEFSPMEETTVDCNKCICVNGTLLCTKHPCPVYDSWSSWSSCSVSCGLGRMTRTRTCEDTEGGPSCGETTQTESCRQPPYCPSWQVYSDCSGSCPYTCEDLWPNTQCLPGPCTPGCTCPSGQVFYRGSCVDRADCPCSVLSLPMEFQSWNESSEVLQPGATVQHLCNTCVCRGGVFHCTSETCDVCSDGEQWRRSPSKEVPLCERSCQDIYSSSPVNCSRSSESCVCREGLYRNAGGVCVIPALCPCHDQGVLREAGSQWNESCESCSCVNGRKLCQRRCPPLHCAEGEMKVEEPGSCCPVCRKPFPDELVPECQRYVQFQNITKGRCHLDNVEVSFCRGRCLSRTDVILEEPYLKSECECCSYRLDPAHPVHFLSLQCENGEVEPVVLPVIQSCECTSCQGGDLSKR
uniref:SCO-spondin n=1 Tax=Oryzias sinensis TaxID=183150 RepID=A0A8C7VBG6_9TELE